MQARRRPVRRIEQVTAPVWASWRIDVLQTVRWPGQLNAARALLHDVPGLPEETRRAMRRRNPKPKQRLLYDAYSEEEFAAIKSAAWRSVDMATERIRLNVARLSADRTTVSAGGSMTPVQRAVGDLLEELARSGRWSGTLLLRRAGRMKSRRGTRCS